MKLAWLANSRPDLLFEISQIAQITLDHFNDGARAHWKMLIAAIRYANVSWINLKFSKRDRGSNRMKGYSEVTSPNNYDLKSQLGRVILLMDYTNAAIPIVFKSYKPRRLARSMLCAEVIALADLFDDVLAVRSQSEHARKRPIPMPLLTDSKSLFYIIRKGSRTNEKGIMLVIRVARRGHKAHEISNICLLCARANLADGFKKAKLQKNFFNSSQLADIVLTANNGSFRESPSLSNSNLFWTLSERQFPYCKPSLLFVEIMKVHGTRFQLRQNTQQFYSMRTGTSNVEK